jgi:hypothetical protein
LVLVPTWRNERCDQPAASIPTAADIPAVRHPQGHPTRAACEPIEYGCPGWKKKPRKKEEEKKKET